jgi:2-dehydropantoate 2-reductase
MRNSSTSKKREEKSWSIDAFPGAGGGFLNGIVDAGLTPYFIQPTTFGEIDGRNPERVETLKRIFSKAHIPHQVVKDMRLWQICHLGAVFRLCRQGRRRFPS